MEQKLHFYILAGGKSRRFGANKALFRIEGQTVIERVIAAIPQFAPVFVVTNSPAEYAFLSLPTVPDKFPGAGPLAGIHAGLLHSPVDWNFFLACDLPLLRPSIIAEICSAPRAAQVILPEAPEALSGVPSNEASRLQPLCALWSKSTLPLVEAALRDGELSVRSLLKKLSLRRIFPSEPEALFNLNTPGELSRISLPDTF
jgi:molybdopterin-guanine dinucleotide biosynthesis protein A